ncbi:hypothetical protein ACXR6G_18265 [Ancylomarina sp. YFZ004]
MKKIFFILFLSLIGTWVVAQEVSVSAKLNEVFSMLPLECKNQVNSASNNNVKCNIRGDEVELKVLFNNTGQLTHIGLNLFSFNEKLIFSPEVLSFMERSMLEYLLLGDVSFIKKKISEDKIELRLNNNSLGEPGFKTLKNTIPILCGPYDFAIKYDGINYSAIFRQGLNEFVMKFPANNNVITGMDKKEYGEQISSLLMNYKPNYKLPNLDIEASSLVKYKDSIKVSIGDSYFKAITSNKYYEIDTTQDIQLVFSDQYPLESFSNIFLVPFDSNKNIDLKIKHKIYGDEVLEYEMPLVNFLLFFEEEFYYYFGVEDSDDETLVGTLIMHNKGLNFINLLSVETVKNDLFGEHPIINASFYTNIPSDNIKNLFSEYDNESDINN